MSSKKWIMMRRSSEIRVSDEIEALVLLEGARDGGLEWTRSRELVMAERDGTAPESLL